MFTGIIEKIGRVLELERREGSAGNSPGCSMEIQVQADYADLQLGESVAVSGVCLTVAALSADGKPTFHISPETLARSNLGSLEPGSPVNLERALALGARLSGHWVQGHVDGLARLERIVSRGESMETSFALPKALLRYCVEKGSIALDGVSLTINRIEGDVVSIVLIPHTWQNTCFSRLSEGARVNVEVDILAKYVESLWRPSPAR